MHDDPSRPLVEDGFLDQLQAELAAAIGRVADEEERLAAPPENALEAAAESSAWQRSLLSLSERLDAWQRGLAALTDEVANVEAELMRHQSALRDWAERSAALKASTKERRSRAKRGA
jgi:predicted  nucleic acid-binding Zn-ribbon protein